MLKNKGNLLNKYFVSLCTTLSLFHKPWPNTVRLDIHSISQQTQAVSEHKVLVVNIYSLSFLVNNRLVLTRLMHVVILLRNKIFRFFPLACFAQNSNIHPLFPIGHVSLFVHHKQIINRLIECPVNILPLLLQAGVKHVAADSFHVTDLFSWALLQCFLSDPFRWRWKRTACWPIRRVTELRYLTHAVCPPAGTSWLW